MFFFQVEEARQLDTRQKEVLSMAVNYAKRVVTFPLASPNQQLSRPSTPGHGSWWRRKWQVETHQLHLQHHDGHLQEGRR